MKITNLYIKTIFDYRKSVFFWSLGIIAIGLMYAFIYTTIGDNPAFTKALDSAGGGVQAFIGSAEFFATPAGFINGEFFSLTMPMILGILSIVIGGALLSKEEESHTMELILARPIKRTKILRDKFLGMLSIIADISLSVWLGLAIGSLLVSAFKLNLWMAALATLNLALLALAFGTLALLITSVKSRRSLAGGVIGVYFILSYIVGTFGSQVDWLNKFRYFSLFHYYDTAEILQHNINWWNFLILATISVVGYLLARFAFANRDSGV